MSNDTLREHILAASTRAFPKVVALRRAIHKNPELAFEEVQTAALVLKTLRGLGIPAKGGIAKTGVVGLITGGSPGPCVALRADMDALPIVEQTKLPYASRNHGVMHACGHDGHTAMALGAAMVLSELRKELKGSVKLLFQPSEERNPGGAPGMIEAGVLANPRVVAIFGQHVLSHADAGTVGFCSGPMMASADELYITIRGKGGHGAKPHVAVDPIVTAAQVVLALQTIVSRRIDPFQQCVVTIGKISGGTTTNIIPDEVKLVGTVRAMNEKVRAQIHREIERIIRGVTSAAGATFTLEFSKGYPVLENDSVITAFAQDSAKRLLGAKRVFHAAPLMGAEDFAYFLQRVPGTFFRLGIRKPGATNAADIHQATFTIDERALLTGTATMAFLAADYLRANG